MHMNRISCVIFDMDGTLTQTNELIFATFNYVTGKYLHKKFSPKEITALFGPPEEVAIRKLIGRERFERAMKDFYSYYEDHHARMAGLHEGIREILEFLKSRGILLAVFTGKGKRTTVITLEKMGIKQYFDMIVTGSDVANHKPSPDGIRKVLSRYSLQPAEVLMVGDAVSDVTAAHAAGVRIAAVLWDSYGREKVQTMDVDERFESVGEFFSWLRNTIPRDGEVTR
jgi:pyrophosphatase PpaX